ncbi:SAC3/GANP/Nin1/mts3/eIF-3 p25 family-domain-containing protein [Xylariaceae sp. FL0804]|nr:SAC3/GANP/Nin1/mts3/eIF-3 p25 family-domain-containing protein [Xylariaceae sp. FL0804]
MLDQAGQGGWGASGATTAPFNPFQPTASSQPLNNPFGAPAPNPFSQKRENGQASAPVNPFEAKKTARNPFLPSATATLERSPSPSAVQPQRPASKPLNPFQKLKAPTPEPKPLPAPVSALGTVSQPNGTYKKAEFVQPAWPKRQNEASKLGLGGLTKPSSLKRKSELAPEARRKSPRTSPAPGVSKISTHQTPQNHDGRARQLAINIKAQLEKDRIKPPPWPRNPGSRGQRQAMEAFRESYKAYRERARQSLIQAGLIDDPDRRRKLDEALDFRGISEEMCPEWEQITRIVEFDILRPEKADDDAGEFVAMPPLMVKRLARSAAGQDAPMPMDVRSFHTLRQTLDYLIDDLIPSDDLLPSRHSFLWDRTRAIRIDLSVQKYNMTTDERKDLIYCLETIARFHVTALHLLSQEGFAAEDFSEQQEVEQLGKTLISLKELYDDCVEQGVECENEAEFRGYYILYNAHNPALKDMIEEWGTRLWDADGIRTATCLAESIENTARLHGPLKPEAPTELALNAASIFFSIVDSPQISYTMACFAEIHFNYVRKAMLRVIKTAYQRPRDGPKDITPAFLQERLRFDTVEEAIDFAQKHNLELSEEGGQQHFVIDPRRPVQDSRIRHAFSRNIVERKRCGRSLPSVIRETVFEDAEPRLSVSSPEESLFVENTADGSFGSEAQSLENDVGSPSATQPSSLPVTSNSLGAASEALSIAQSSASDTAKPPIPSIFEQANATARQQPHSFFPPTTSTKSETPKLSDKDHNAVTEPQPTHEDRNKGQEPSGSTPSSTLPPKVEKKVRFGESTSLGPSGAAPAAGPAPSVFGFLNNKGTSQGLSYQAMASADNPFAALLAKQTSELHNAQPKDTPSSEAQPSSLFALAPPNETPKISAQPEASSSTDQFSIFRKPETLTTTIQQPDMPLSFTQSTPSLKHLAHPRDISSSLAPLSGFREPAPVQPIPKKDPMSEFTRWFVCADKGLMEERFVPFIIENLLKDTWESFRVEKIERQRKEEDDRSWAEARKFRTYSLKVTYFYRWLDTFRRRRVIKRLQMNKEKSRQWRLPENVAERERAAKAEKERSVKEAAEMMRRRTRGNIEEAAKLRGPIRSRRESREQNIEEALLASGVLNGVPDERAAARQVAQGDGANLDSTISPVEKSRMQSENQRRRRRGLPPLKQFPEPKAYKEGSKTAMLRALSRGTGRDSLSLSTGSLRNSTFSSSYRSSLGLNSSRVSKSRTKVSDPYWRMKANGLVEMPNGDYLPESLALPMLQEGKRYPGLGDYGLPPPENSPSRSRSDSDGGSTRSSYSASPPSVAGGGGPGVMSVAHKRKRGEEADAELEAYRSETPATATRKRARSGGAGAETTPTPTRTAASVSDDRDFLASIANLLSEVDRAAKSTAPSS